MALVGRFASSIVHDLKNPLTIISIATEMACTDEATSQARTNARERIASQVERITSMVNDILEFTRGSQTSQTLAVSDFAEFIQPLLAEFRPEVALKSVTIEFANPPPAVKLPLNPKRLARVFYNLIHNAVDAMPEGGRIKLRFQLTDNEVITEIEDSGAGIPPQIMEHLFEAFATYGKTKGTGLGLSICQRIVQEHGGKISAHNRPDGGAVFAFTLPRR